MIVDRTEEFKKYLERHPDRTINVSRNWLGVEKVEAVFPDGKSVLVRPNELLPE